MQMPPGGDADALRESFCISERISAKFAPICCKRFDVLRAYVPSELSFRLIRMIPVIYVMN